VEPTIIRHPAALSTPPRPSRRTAPPSVSVRPLGEPRIIQTPRTPVKTPTRKKPTPTGLAGTWAVLRFSHTCYPNRGIRSPKPIA